MAAIGFYLLNIIVILLLIIYFKLVYKCKRGVKITLDHVQTKSSSKTIEAEISENGIVLPQPPGPFPWPILGNLALLGKYASPFQGFTELSKIYGDIFSLTLGTTRCVVVNNLELIKEVLNENGKFFGGRPDFIRYRRIFGGDRSNSLALCDWSVLQQKRRNLARKHCSPRDGSKFFDKMNDIGCNVVQDAMEMLKSKINPAGEVIHLKPIVQKISANLFTLYMSSTKFDYDDSSFESVIRAFDEVFWEINQGYAVDFLPWLSPFYSSHFETVDSWAKEIREFILNKLINPRYEKMENFLNDGPEDFLDTLLSFLTTEENVSEDTIIYMMEDFIGGHSAIGNLVYIALGYIAKYPEIGRKIQEETSTITNNGERGVNLYDIENMPYTVATVFEILRHSSSPIVPHVATENSQISGYGIPKDTIVFINNYELNTSDKLWDNPKDFQPERFLERVPAQKVKKDAPLDAPDFTRVKKNIPQFLPFSVGKRTCIGQNLVRSYTFLLLTHILGTFDVSTDDPSSIKLLTACVALPPDTFPLRLTPRTL